MFGYIRAAKPELRVKEFEMYKAVYCSLCRSLGKQYGIFSRFTLSYDFTFLALLNMSMTNSCDAIERKRCPFNPLKKCNYCKSDNGFKMPSAAAIIMLYYKILDNISDEKGFKKFGFKILKLLFSRAHKKASSEFPEIEEMTASYIKKQSLLEKQNCKNLDEVADPSAELLSKLLMLCSDDEMQKRVLNRIGYCLGRYIYLIDAAVDIEEDIKNNSYNVLKYSLEGNPKEYAKKRIIPQLYFCSNEASKAFELLDIKKYKPILGNIIYLGLEDTFKKELEK